MATSVWQAMLVFSTVTNLYGVGFVAVAVVTRSRLLVEPKFSLPRFYSLMGWAPLAFLALGVAIDPRYLALFFATGLAGIAGELLVSAFWKTFFDAPIWTYSYRSVLGGATSTLNFLPWAVGALLFVETGRLFDHSPRSAQLAPMLIASIAIVVGLAIALLARRRTSARSGRFTKTAFGVFCAPIVTTAVALGIWSHPRYVAMMAAFALIGFFTEYVYGRGMSLVFERSLWRYNHLGIDGGHTSFVTLPLWALGGLYFHFIGRLVGP